MPKSSTPSSSVAVVVEGSSPRPRPFRPGDLIRGHVLVRTSKAHGLRHHGLRVELVGRTALRVDVGTVGLLDAFALGDPEGVTWVSRAVDLDCPVPEFPFGTTRLDFELPLATHSARQIYETQRGVQVNTRYLVMATLQRPGLSFTEMGPKTLSDEVEILVQAPLTARPASVPATKFRMNPSTSTIVVGPSDAFTPHADFELVGACETVCDLAQPLRGHLLMTRTSVPVEQIEVQVVRVESVPWTEDELVQEEAEVIRCQVVDGPLPDSTVVPFQVLLPRLWAAPSVDLDEFSLAFELNFLVHLADGSLWRGTLDVVLYRFEDDEEEDVVI